MPRPTARGAPVTVPAAVFERLLAGIVGGTWVPGARLPAERELVRVLGASRASVRDALRRLAAWRLVAIRHGSGAVVRPRLEWSFAALPASLRPDGIGLASPLVDDALALRRALVVGMIQLAGGRVVPGALAAARATVAEAWRARADVDAFAALDLDVLRRVLEAAGLLPAVWLLNDVAGVYRDAVRALDGRGRVPADYVAAHRRVFDALERGDGRGAAALMAEYLDRADRGRLGASGHQRRAPRRPRRRTHDSTATPR